MAHAVASNCNPTLAQTVILNSISTSLVITDLTFEQKEQATRVVETRFHPRAPRDCQSAAEITQTVEPLLRISCTARYKKLPYSLVMWHIVK